jgi:hypothetical protein
MASYAYTFTSGDTVTPTKLNNARTISNIVNADISATAAIAGTKIAPAFGAQDITLSSNTRSITNISNHALAFGTNNTERMRLAAAGQIIVGHNAAINVTGSGGFDTLQVASGTVSGLATLSYWADNETPCTLNFFKGKSGTVGSVGGAVQAGTPLGSITWHGDDGAASRGSARIRAEVDGAVASAEMPGRLTFDTTPAGSASPSERMRIDSAGNVGIGTTAPNAAAILHLGGTTKGFLPPRMTTAQRDAIGTPPAGLMIYNTSTNKLQVRTNTAWVDLH